MNEWILVPACIIAAGAVAFSIYNSYKSKKVLDRVEEMLDEAIDRH